MIDTETAIGIVAAPGIVAAVIGILKPLLLRWLPSDAIPAIALLLSIGYVLLAWQAEVIEAENAFVAVLLGVHRRRRRGRCAGDAAPGAARAAVGLRAPAVGHAAPSPERGGRALSPDGAVLPAAQFGYASALLVHGFLGHMIGAGCPGRGGVHERLRTGIERA